ncbi:hypothetical protein [Abyssogena phaseoliformis symbiont]|uniref:hypothetical protein n=1 Tax=Abyssogena phaseoliformis symbiont TaxID=596095 RepID=UPI001915072F|nr:hypothetical protein [Abyssogena phaseoliformis symbiont]
MSQIHKHLLAESSLSIEAVEIQHQAYLGNAEAQYQLADIFQKGKGVFAQNYVNAFLLV